MELQNEKLKVLTELCTRLIVCDTYNNASVENNLISNIISKFYASN